MAFTFFKYGSFNYNNYLNLTELQLIGRKKNACQNIFKDIFALLRQTDFTNKRKIYI